MRLLSNPFLRSRTVAIISCLLVGYTPCAAGWNEVGGGLFSFAKRVWQQGRGIPQNTDYPTPISLGDNPERQPDYRGGVWNDKTLAILQQQTLQDQLNANPGLLNADMSLGNLLFMSSGSGGGSSYPWEHQIGDVNTNTGNKRTSIPIVSYKVRGSMSVGLALTHNSDSVTSTWAGQNWRSTYDIKIKLAYDVDGNIIGANVYWGDGTIIPYTSSDNGATYVAPNGIYDKLAPNGGGTFKITRHDQTVWNFNSSGRPTSEVDRSGNTLSITYDGSSRLYRVTDPNSRYIQFGYDGSNRINSITDPASRVWSVAYDASSNITSIGYPSLSGTVYYRTFTYDGSHNILTETDLRGKVWTYTYDANHGVLTEKDPNNNTTSFSYSGSATTETLPGSQTIVDNYSSGQLASEVDSSSYSDSYTYDSAHNKLTHTDKRGKVWTYTYDARGNVLTEKNPLNKTTTYTYNTTNDLLTVTDALSHVTTMTVNSAGEPLTVVNPLSQTRVTNVYNGYGQLTSATDANSHATTYTYTSNGDLYTSSDPLSHTTTYAYDTLGRQTSASTPGGSTESIAYDEWERPVTYTHQGGSTVTKAYDKEDHVTGVTDELSHTTTLAYDDAGRLTGVTNARGDGESYGYNTNNWRTTVTNGRGKIRTYAYTARGEVYTLTMPDSAVETWTYNANGEVSAYTNPLSQTINYGYDDASRKTSVTYPLGTGNTYTYDDAGRQTGMTDSTGTTTWTLDNAGQVTGLTTPQETLSYTYDSAGRKATMVETGVGTTTYTYDNANRLTTLANPFSESTTFAFSTDNMLTTQTYSTGAYETLGYDARNRLTSITHKDSGGTTLDSESYTLDAAGNLTSKTVNGTTTSYTYDAIDQILTEAYSGYSASYTYDANGNRATKVLNGVTDTYTYDDGDKLTSTSSKTYTYDAAGRTKTVVSGGNTTTLTYDYEDRVTGITYPGGGTNSFTYNGLDTRVGKVDSVGTFTYKRDGVGVTSPVINDSAANYTPGISEHRGGNSKFYHGERQGSTAGITDATQAVTDSRTYDAFGLLLASSGSTPTPFGYVGAQGYQEDGDSGLKLLGHRYYDPSTGRFLTRDHAKSGRNWITYAKNNPTKYIDAVGFDPELAACAVELTELAGDGGLTVVEGGGGSSGVTLTVVEGGAGSGGGGPIIMPPPPPPPGFITWICNRIKCLLTGEEVESNGGHTVSPPSPAPNGGGGSKRKSKSRLVREWEDEQGFEWPKDPETNHPMVAHHIRALADGGEDHGSNIMPVTPPTHIEIHTINGDFKRWGSWSAGGGP